MRMRELPKAATWQQSYSALFIDSVAENQALS